jgi:hypothetical protein
MQCILVTTDFITYSNYQGTASKNVVSVAPLTNAEMSADYAINGSSADYTADLGFNPCIQVNDVLYGTYLKYGTSDRYLFKIDGTTFTEVLMNIPNITRGNGLHEVYLFYNGNNILISCITDDAGTVTKELWATPMDLSTFVQKYTIEIDVVTREPISMPENLDQVDGEYAMYVKDGVNEGYLYLTNDKFFI